MKSKNRFIKTIIILTLLFLIIFNTSISSTGQELTGEEIISKVNELMNQDTVQAKVNWCRRLFPLHSNNFIRYYRIFRKKKINRIKTREYFTASLLIRTYKPFNYLTLISLYRDI